MGGEDNMDPNTRWEGGKNERCKGEREKLKSRDGWEGGGGKWKKWEGKSKRQR
jgi:hypothetical protein